MWLRLGCPCGLIDLGTIRAPVKFIVLWEPSNARQRLDKHVPTVTKLFALQRQQYRRGANIQVTQDINDEARCFLCNRNKVI
jgi:hypothetical protein